MTMQFQKGLMVFGAAITAIWLIGVSYSLGQDGRMQNAAQVVTTDVLQGR